MLHRIIPLFTIVLVARLSWHVAAQDDETPEPVVPLSQVVHEIEPGFELIGTSYKQIEIDIDLCYTSGCELDFKYGGQCLGWNYINGTCYFLHNFTSIVANPVSKAVRVSFAKMGYDDGYIYNDVKFGGKTLGQAKTATIQDCLPICKNTPGCRSYSWTNSSTSTNGTCSLKGKTEPALRKVGVQSAMAYPSGLYAPAVVIIEKGIEIVGNDYTNDSGVVFDVCRTRCLQDWNNCKAFSWSSSNSGTCLLKNGIENSRVNAATASGVVVAGIAP